MSHEAETDPKARPHPLDDYIACEGLSGVPDVFDATLLWERVGGWWVLGRSPQATIRGTFLLDALRRHPRLARGRRRERRWHPHVVVRLPEADLVRDHRLEEGARRKELARALAETHGRELGRLIPPGAEVRYQVAAGPGLEPGEVRFQVGHAVHVPAGGEAPLLCLDIDLEDGQGWREAGAVHSGQRLLLVNADPWRSTACVPGWPFPAPASLVLVYDSREDRAEAPGSEPLGALAVSPLADEEGSYRVSDGERRVAVRVRRLRRQIDGIEDTGPERAEPVIDLGSLGRLRAVEDGPAAAPGAPLPDGPRGGGERRSA